MNEEAVGKAVLDSAFHVHTELGPGLLESVYEAVMCLDLQKKGFKVEQQKAIPVFFDGVKLDVGFRADLIINNLVLVELKSVEAVTPLFKNLKLPATNSATPRLPNQFQRRTFKKWSYSNCKRFGWQR